MHPESTSSSIALSNETSGLFEFKRLCYHLKRAIKPFKNAECKLNRCSLDWRTSTTSYRWKMLALQSIIATNWRIKSDSFNYFILLFRPKKHASIKYTAWCWFFFSKISSRRHPGYESLNQFQQIIQNSCFMLKIIQSITTHIIYLKNSDLVIRLLEPYTP